MSLEIYRTLHAAAATLRRDLEALRASGAVPRLHPNGFIQIDLTSDTRAHVWPEPGLPTAQPYCPIHDHTYGFYSLVVLGLVHNVNLEPVEDAEGGYCLWRIKQWADERRTPTPRPIDGRRYALRKLSEGHYGPTVLYKMEPFVFHLSETDAPTVTIIKVLPSAPGRAATIAAPRDIEPDGRFERDVSPERQSELWDIVFATIPS